MCIMFLQQIHRVSRNNMSFHSYNNKFAEKNLAYINSQTHIYVVFINPNL